MRLHDARKLALELMAEHGLTRTGRAPNFGVRVWRFTFDNAVRRFGVCRYHNGTISLSRVLVKLNTDAEVRATILHEIAHALAVREGRSRPLTPSLSGTVGPKDAEATTPIGVAIRGVLVARN